MRSFSNIMPNFADKLHLLVDSIFKKKNTGKRKKLQKYLVGVVKVRTFASANKGTPLFSRGLVFVRAMIEIFERLT